MEVGSMAWEFGEPSSDVRIALDVVEMAGPVGDRWKLIWSALVTAAESGDTLCARRLASLEHIGRKYAVEDWLKRGVERWLAVPLQEEGTAHESGDDTAEEGEEPAPPRGAMPGVLSVIIEGEDGKPAYIRIPMRQATLPNLGAVVRRRITASRADYKANLRLTAFYCGWERSGLSDVNAFIEAMMSETGAMVLSAEDWARARTILAS